VTEPRQKPLDIEPEYAINDGIKHEFTGTLFIPVAGEVPPPAPEPAMVQNISAFDIAESHLPKPTRHVKLKASEFLKLRGGQR
jgi:hypothetical protein